MNYVADNVLRAYIDGLSQLHDIRDVNCKLYISEASAQIVSNKMICSCNCFVKCHCQITSNLCSFEEHCQRKLKRGRKKQCNVFHEAYAILSFVMSLFVAQYILSFHNRSL